jgi:hypothetical protein
METSHLPGSPEVAQPLVVDYMDVFDNPDNYTDTQVVAEAFRQANIAAADIGLKRGSAVGWIIADGIGSRLAVLVGEKAKISRKEFRIRLPFFKRS